MSDALVTASGGYERQRPTSPRRVLARERELQALELRKAGLTYARIGELLGVSHVAVGKAVRRALAKHSDQTKEAVEELRQLELERLDAVNLAFWEKMMAGDVQAAKLILRTIEQRSRLLGLEAPRPLVTIDQRQVSLERPEPPPYEPVEPEKMELAMALMALPAAKREFLMNAPENGLRPAEALAEIVAGQTVTAGPD